MPFLLTNYECQNTEGDKVLQKLVNTVQMPLEYKTARTMVGNACKQNKKCEERQDFTTWYYEYRFR